MKHTGYNVNRGATLASAFSRLNSTTIDHNGGAVYPGHCLPECEIRFGHMTGRKLPTVNRY